MGMAAFKFSAQRYKLAGLGLLLVASLFSCDPQIQYDGRGNTLNTAKESLAIAFLLHAVDETLDRHILSPNITPDSAAFCADLDDSGPGNWPREFVMDFGTGCTDEHGVTRSGTLRVTLTGPHDEPGSVATLTFEGFSIHPPEAYSEPWLLTDPTIVVEGVRTLERQNVQGLAAWDCSHDLTAHFLNHELTDQMVGQRFALSGWDGGDSHFGYLGTHTTTRDGGPDIIRTLADTLLHVDACMEPVQGVFVIDRSADETEVHGWLTSEMQPLEEAVLDFGQGSCDSVAEITVLDEVEVVPVGYFTNW